MLGALGIFILALFCLVCLGAIAWVLYLHLRARRYNLPAPTLSSYFRQPSSSYQSSYTPRPRSNDSGLLSKLKGLIPGAKNKRSTIARGNFGPVGDDAAWDTRGYYEEEAEIGLDPPRSGTGNVPQINASTQGHNRSHSGGYDSDPESPPRGRSRSRSPRYSVEDQGQGRFVAQQPQSGQQKGSRGVGGENPFSDRHEMNDGFGRPVGVKGGSGLVGDSPTSLQSERRSMFREESF